MEQQLQKLTQAILARGKLLKQLEVQCAAIQASVEEMKPKPVTPPAQASSSRSLATGELDAPMLTGCSMNCPDDDTDSRTSAFMPDVAPGPPSTATLRDVVITSTSVLTSTPSGDAVRSIDLGDEHVPKLPCCQLGAHKLFDEMPIMSTVVRWPPPMKWDERQLWPPPSRVVIKCSGEEGKDGLLSAAAHQLTVLSSTVSSIDGWNSMDNCYAFLYVKEEKVKKKRILMKCPVIGEFLTIDVRDVEAQQKEPYHVQAPSATMILDKKESSVNIDLEALPLVRRADFSHWLQDSVYHRVQGEVGSLSDARYLEHIILLLTGRQLDTATEVAASRGDVRLAILLSQAAGSMLNQSDVAQQLDLWKPPPPLIDEDEIGQWQLKFLESKLTARVIFTVGLGLIIYAGKAGGDDGQEFIFGSTNDMTAKRLKNGSWLLPLALIPFVGPSLYLLRPSLSSLLMVSTSSSDEPQKQLVMCSIFSFNHERVISEEQQKRGELLLDVGRGVASFGGYMFDSDVLTISIALKDEHAAQVQFALERGIPVISDVVHWAHFRDPWHMEGGMLLPELNHLLCPSGYVVWFAPPVYQWLPKDVEIWNAMFALTKSMCWKMVKQTKDKLNQIGVSIYEKPMDNNCYEKRPEDSPLLCEGTDNADYTHWNRAVRNSNVNGLRSDWSKVRNVMLETKTNWEGWNFDVGYFNWAATVMYSYAVVVALKTLIVIHRALQEDDPTFRDELISYGRSGTHMLHLSYFKDDSSPEAWDYSAWVHNYALFLEERLESFRILQYDVETDPLRTRDLDTTGLLDELPALQQLLFRLLDGQLQGSSSYNIIIQQALSMVALESVRIHTAINDVILNLVDKFFEMQRDDAIRALDISKRAISQAEQLSEFYEVCKTIHIGHGERLLRIEHAPASFLQAMEEYVRDAPLASTNQRNQAVPAIQYRRKPEDEEASTSPPAEAVSAPVVISSCFAPVPDKHLQVLWIPVASSSSAAFNYSGLGASRISRREECHGPARLGLGVVHWAVGQEASGLLR